MTLGIFIWRLDPPHIWHTQIIKRTLKENNKVLLLLWVNEKNNNKNLFEFNIRRKLLNCIFINKTKLNILKIKDNKDDLVWIQNIIKIINNNYKKIKKINFYGWDFENDSAFISFKEYEKQFKNFKINYILNSRKKSKIEFKWKKYKISSTNLRQAIIEKNYKLIEKFCDKTIFDKLKIISKAI